MRDELPTTSLLDVPIHAITEGRCIDFILSELQADRGGWVATPNLDMLRRCVRDAAFRSLMLSADLVVADGMPLVWASRLRGAALPERVAGSTLVTTLSAAASGRQRSVFLLGGAPGSADGAAQVLRGRIPSIVIAGTHCPPLGFESNPDEMARIEHEVGKSAADIVYVALGSPKQERLIVRLQHVLPHAWWLGVGVSFSFLCGQVRRAPIWMQRSGLEWAHRLAQEPGRLSRRYLIDGLPFAARLLAQAAWEGAITQRALRAR